MTITYTTTVVSLPTAKSLDGLTDVVTSVNTLVTATDGTYIAQSAASTPVDSPDPTDFTPFADLTEEQVLSWIPDPASPEVMAALTENVEGQANPPISTLPPPWA